MATTRDVKMTLSVDTLGEDGVKSLQQSIQALANQGGDAAPAFQKLADEVGRLGEQSQSLAAFRALGDATEALRDKQTQAAVSSEKLSAELAALKEKTAAAKTSQQEAADAYSKGQAAVIEASAALKTLKLNYDEAGKKTEAFATDQKKLIATQTEAKVALIALRDAQKASTAELNAAEAAQKKAQAALEKQDKFTTALTKSLSTQESALKQAADATEALGLSATDVAASEGKLLAAMNQLGAEADQHSQKMKQAADYVQFWTTELDQAEAAAKQLQGAFNTLNIRSAETIQAEIAQVRAALQSVQAQSGTTGQALSGAFTAADAKIKALELELRQLNGTLTIGDKTAALFKNSLGQIAAGNIVADGVGYLVNKVKELGQAFLGAIVQGDQLKRGLNAVYKDAEITAKQIDFLRKASSESGVAFGALSGEFVKFTASMKMANIPMEQSNALFQAVTAASASLGLSAEATGGTLNALGQMASKGTVSLEELRAQLGDRLPGALGLTAQGLGITEGALIKLVESGQLATRDFVVPFTKALGQLKGETDGLVPSWERLKGVLTQLAQGMGDAGGTQVLTGALKTLGGLLGTLALGFSVIVERSFGTAKALGVLAASVTTLTNPLEALKQLFTESADRLVAQNEALNVFIDGSGNAANAANAHAQAMTSNTAAVAKSIAANTELDTAQKLTALSAALAADTTLDAAAKIVQYNVAAAELLKAQQGQTEAYEKLAKAAKEQGATLVENAKLTGDNTAVQTASLQAAQLYAEAVDKATNSHQLETAALIAQKAELEASATARGLTALQIKTQTDELDKLITASKAETEQSVQAQAAASAEVTARQLASAALLDNASRLDSYREAVVATQAEVERLKVVEAAGIDVKAQLEAAQQQLTTATFMYRDAVKDLATNIELETKVQSANLQLSIAQATASQNHYTAMAAEARASGDVALAVQYEVKAKEEAIRVLKLKLELDQLQQQADLLIIDAKRKLIDVETEDGQQKLKLLDIETQMVKIKETGNQAILDQISALERETQSLRDGTSAAGSFAQAMDGGAKSNYSFADSADAATSALQRQNAELEESISAREKALDLKKREEDLDYEELWGESKEDFEERNENAGSVLNAVSATQAGMNAGLTEDEAYDLYTRVHDSHAISNNGTGLYDWQTYLKALSEYKVEKLRLDDVARQKAPGAAPASTSSTFPSAAPSAPAGKTYTVNVTINGRTQSVNVASDADANNLTSILRTLETAANTAA